MAIFEVTHLRCLVLVPVPVLVPVLEQRHGHAFEQPLLDVLAEHVAGRPAGHAKNLTAFPASDIAGIVGRVAGRGCLEES